MCVFDTGNHALEFVTGALKTRGLDCSEPLTDPRSRQDKKRLEASTKKNGASDAKRRMTLGTTELHKHKRMYKERK